MLVLGLQLKKLQRERFDFSLESFLLIDLIQAGYCSLIGNNEHSWGWDLGRNILRHSEEQVAPACMANHQENHNKLSYPPMDDTVRDPG